MTELAWILLGGVLMSAIALVGGLVAFLQPRVMERLLLPLVALAAGTLLGGACFHMIPEAAGALAPRSAAVWGICGFALFLALEQVLHWHHSHRGTERMRHPRTYLILIGDGVHNFLGGLGIASAFLIDARAGMVAWVAAAAHEIPQELGDFGVLVHGGWPRGQALLWNTASGSTFLVGALLAYAVAGHIETAGLVLFAAGNFVYIAASDLIPEIKEQARPKAAALHFGCFAVGLGLTFALSVWAPA